MTYALQSHLAFAAGGDVHVLALTDWDGDGTIDVGVVAEALARADGWIDGFLRLRYTTPIATPSDTLIRIAADEAVYWLRCKRNMLTPEHVIERKDRERQLEEMRDGKLRPDEPLPAKSTAVAATFVENDHPVSRRGMRGIW